MSARIIHGDCRAILPALPAGSVQCCVTSPPYLGLRDYGVGGQIGLEGTPDAYVAEMVAVFREVRRVLRDDGTCWLNIGDSYVSNGRYDADYEAKNNRGGMHADDVKKLAAVDLRPAARAMGIKPKDLMMIPARVALALQADGWFLRSDIIWHKPNPMPESVTDRPTSSHEHVFLLSKSARYFYDANAIREAPSESFLREIADGYHGSDTKLFAASGAQSASGTKARIIEKARGKIDKQRGHGRRHDGFNERWDRLSKEEQQAIGANSRNVWTIATQPFSGAHFATMPPELVERCIKAGSKPGDTILDPFGGAGTTGLVADRLGRHALLIELSLEYIEIAKCRLVGDAPLFAEVSA